jgi:AraC-like DNA-binding protein
LARLFEKRGALGIRVEGQLAFTILAMRLSSLCGRALKRSPSDLIRQRVISGTDHAAGNQREQIAFELGFKDTAHFRRLFGRRIGKAPVAWRHRMARREAVVCRAC